MRVSRWSERFNEQERLGGGEVARAMGKSALAAEPSGYYSHCASIRFDGEKRERVGMKLLAPKNFVMLIVVALLISTFGCSDANEINPSDVGGFNYTSYYIAGFRVVNEGQELSAGGPNIFPRKKGEERSGGGKFMCCIGIPRHWRPDAKLVVQWRRDTHPYDEDRSGDQWLTATTAVPSYGPHTYGFWVHFLPGDRIRVEIQDKPEMPGKPDDDDPYIVQGVLDPELNKE
jgi:hypothetical protein